MCFSRFIYSRHRISLCVSSCCVLTSIWTASLPTLSTILPAFPRLSPPPASPRLSPLMTLSLLPPCSPLALLSSGLAMAWALYVPAAPSRLRHRPLTLARSAGNKRQSSATIYRTVGHHGRWDSGVGQSLRPGLIGAVPGYASGVPHAEWTKGRC